jgi:hypothetical protein
MGGGVHNPIARVEYSFLACRGEDTLYRMIDDQQPQKREVTHDSEQT